MFSIKSLFQAVRSWHRGRGGPKTPRRNAPVALERLDHRQLLSANFTGNAITDIPTTNQPGTVILLDNGTTRHPGIPADLQSIIKVSGLDLDGVRLQYTPNDDILSIALQQPDNQKTGQPVLSGDTDNNGDGATVAPAVQALRPAFIDFGFLGGSESMGAFLDLNSDGIPDVVAGIAGDAAAGKLYQVADAVVNPDPVVAAGTIPVFGDRLLNNTGASFLTNDPNRPAFEFQVTNFSQLYQVKTGQPLQTDTIIRVGAFGTSDSDDGISEAFQPAQNANFGVVPPVTPPPPPMVCPPLEPPIKINPHENNHVNTAHPTDVRVYVLGTAGFDPRNIIPATVQLGGATPIASFSRNVNHDAFPDKTFVFRGSDITLPRGVTYATVTGTLTDGTTFQSKAKVFNRDDSFYGPRQIAARDARQARAGFDAENPPLTPFQMGQIGSLNLKSVHDLAMEHENAARAADFEATARPTVKIPTRNRAATVTHVNSGHSATMTAGVGTAAASTASGVGDSPLTVSIPRRPVTQAQAPVTVTVPRRSVVTTKAATPRTRPLASVPTRVGFARATANA